MAVFGAGVWQAPMTYELWVGLWMNLERVQLRKAFAVCQGVGLAHSEEPVAREYLDAIARCDAEVDELLFQVNAERQRHKAMARVRPGVLGG